MTNGWVLPEGVLRDAPAYTPRPHELADLELLLSGAYAPLTGFLGRADLTSLARTGRLADGTPWPVPVTLEVPPRLVDQLDIDNPLRRVLVLDRPRGRAGRGDRRHRQSGRPAKARSASAGRVRRIGDGGQGPFRRLRRAPAEVTRAAAAGPGARRVRRPAAAPPAAGPDRARRPHPGRSPAGADPGRRPDLGRPAARVAGALRARRPRPDAAGHDRRGAAGPRTATRSATRCCAPGWPPRTA